MNKNLMIVVGVIVLLLLGGGVYMSMNKKSVSPLNPSTGAPTQASTQSASKSLKDLFLSGVAQKCTFSDNSTGGNMMGTTYISSGKMRGDINTTVDGKSTVTHMIVSGNTNYIWMDDATTGFKMSFDPQNIDTKNTQNQGLDMNKSINYNCSPGTVDSAKFTPPANVKFTDYSSLMTPSGTKTAPAVGNSVSCSACDSLSGESKTQCRTALKCE